MVGKTFPLTGKNFPAKTSRMVSAGTRISALEFEKFG
jgi:hypothetical protein